jgi:crotonobetainyl-CoA:carnitine CoA-transferase CaiB-like acyl-CoA transferase
MSDNTQDLNFLQGVKVVDFTQFEAGTTSTEVLAWFGAEVVKIENPGRGDPGRRLRPGKPDDDPWYFHQFNVNKKSLAINLKSPKGLDIVKEMLKMADVTVENMAPGTIERLGLDYESVKKLNPGIIYCQVKGFGTGSPHEKGLAFDMIAQAAGGPISVTGEPDRPPVKPGLSFGGHHPRRLARAQSDWPRPAAASGDAGRNDPLHAHLLCDDGAHRQGSAAQRRQVGRWQQCPIRALPGQGRRPQRLCLPDHQPG